MENDALKRIKPARKWYLLPIILFVAGISISACLLISAFTAPIHTINFWIPSNSQIYIMQPGEYTLWTEIKTPLSKEEIAKNLVNTSLIFIDPTTQQITYFRPSIGWDSFNDAVKHFSLGTINFKHPGKYLVKASTNNLVPFQVYLRKPSLKRILSAIAWSAIWSFLGIMTAALSAIIILVKRLSWKNRMSAEIKPLSSSPNEPPTRHAINWAMICHLSGFAGFLVPIANIIAPLIIWGFKRQEYPYLDEQGREAINFQISVSIYYLIAGLLILVIIGLFLLPLIAAFHIIAMIIASIESAQGKAFRYPLTLRFLQSK